MFGEDNRTEEQKEYGKFRHKFALSMVLITLGGPIGIFIGVLILISQAFSRPSDLFGMFITPIILLVFTIVLILLMFLFVG